MAEALRRDKAAADELQADATGDVTGDAGSDDRPKGSAGDGTGAADAKEPRVSAELAAEVQRLGCIALGALADGRPEVQTILVDEGLAEAVLDGLEWYQLHAPLNQWALYALFNMAYDHQSNKVYLLKKGAFAAVVSAMGRHRGELDLQRQGIAFFFCCLRAEAGVDATNMRQVAHTAGMKDAISASMAAHPTARPVAYWGCRAVRACARVCGAGAYRLLGGCRAVRVFVCVRVRVLVLAVSRRVSTRREAVRHIG